jgi:hypothetical protein
MRTWSGFCADFFPRSHDPHDCCTWGSISTSHLQVPRTKCQDGGTVRAVRCRIHPDAYTRLFFLSTNCIIPWYRITRSPHRMPAERGTVVGWIRPG